MQLLNEIKVDFIATITGVTIVESVNRKTLTKLIEKGILTEEELKGMYDIETRYSLHVDRV